MGETIFQPRDFSRSGSKAIEREREKERLNDGINNSQAMHGARMAHASRLGQNRMENQLCFQLPVLIPKILFAL